MGWSSIAMAQRYQHPAEDMARDAILAAATVAESRVPASPSRPAKHDVTDRTSIVEPVITETAPGMMIMMSGEGQGSASAATLTV
jgi:hypothetical protein